MKKSLRFGDRDDARKGSDYENTKSEKLQGKCDGRAGASYAAYFWNADTADLYRMLSV